MEIKKRLIDGNNSFVKRVSNKAEVKNLVNGQHPFALVITCSDSRVIPEEIFNCSLGELFIIRTAGNVINEGELASIEYGIEHLNIKYVLVLGHTHCGAVHASIHDEKGTYLSPILDNIKATIKDEQDELIATLMNANRQVEYIKEKFPHYDGEIESALYDIETNKVIFESKI